MQVPIVGALIKSVAEISNLPKETKLKHTNPVRAQRRELRKLLRRAQLTAFGQHYGFAEILRSRDITDA